MKSSVLKLVLSGIVFIGVFWFVTQRTVEVQRSDAKSESHEKLEATYAAEALQWYNDQRAFPAGRIPTDWREKALAKIQAIGLQKPLRALSSIAWTSVGPSNIGGRVRSIALDTINHIIYCGSVSGGIWKSTDAGISWSPLTDMLPNLVIGCIVIDPTNPSIIYAGTGEGYYNVDALRGVGVLKSTDGGATWSVLNNFVSATAPVSFINKIVIRPDNHNILYLAASSIDVGIWKSVDGGGTWSKLSSAGGLQNSGSLKFCTDLVIDPTNPDVMYGAFGLFNTNGIWKSTNGGTSWAKLTNGFPSTSTKYLRISLAIAQSDPQTLYACLADSNFSTHRIQKTTDGGFSWSAVTTPFDNQPLINSTHLGRQGWYNNVIAVDPTNANVVFTGGINVFRSINGGTNWTRVSDGYAGGIHVDQHAIVFDPSNTSTIYFGNDGGIYKSSNGGSTFTNLNNGFVTIQFYSGAVHPIVDTYYGGTQDNGTLKIATGSTWTQVFSGDGGVTIVDPTTPTTVYTEYVYLAIQKSTNEGVNFSKSINGIPSTGPNPDNGTSDRCSFIAPFTMDPSNSQTLIAGTFRVFRTTTGGDFWNAISSDLTGDGASSVGSSGSVITALAIAKTSSAIMYVGTSGFDTLSSRIQVTTNTGTSWTNITKSPLPKRYVKALAIDPTTANRVTVVYSGYDANTPTTPGHVFSTTNRGTTWLNISGNLPDIPVNCVLLDSTNSNHLLIGTDMGIFETSDGGSSWLPQNSGLANVSIADLDIRNDRFVFAATHGRGMFKSTAPFGATLSTSLSIMVHQNPVLSQYIDVFVTASESLSSAPSLTITSGTGLPQIIPIVQHSYHVFKGDYVFTSSGIVTLNTLAQDSSGQNIAASRIFQAQLLKQSEGGSIQSPDGEIVLRVGSNVLNEDMYFTVIPEVNGNLPASILGKTYTLGPERNFGKSVSLSFNYADHFNGGDVRHLTIMRKTETGWSTVDSRVDMTRMAVIADISDLGSFALGYQEHTISPIVPERYSLEQNFPNPFNPNTTIRFTLIDRGFVRLTVYDLNGKEVTTLVYSDQESGQHDVVWNGRTAAGDEVASGIYFYKLVIRSGNEVRFQAAGKMMLLK